MSRQRGSATVWVLAVCVLFLTISGVAVLRASAVLARHRAESAADLAALAAASRLGKGAAPCAQARLVARANGVDVTSCRVRAAGDGRSGEVTVDVALRTRFPGVGVEYVRATARAGRCGMLAANDPERAFRPRTRRTAATNRKVSAWRSRSDEPKASRPLW